MENRARELLGRADAFKSLDERLDLALESIAELRKLQIERNSTVVGEFDKFRESCESAKTWISEKQEEQSKKDLTEDPVVAMKYIMGKGFELKKQVEKIMKLKLPPALKQSPATSETDKEQDGNVTSKGPSENVNSAASEDPLDDEKNLWDVPPEPDSEGAQADAASGAAGKDEL